MAIKKHKSASGLIFCGLIIACLLPVVIIYFTSKPRMAVLISVGVCAALALYMNRFLEWVDDDDDKAKDQSSGQAPKTKGLRSRSTKSKMARQTQMIDAFIHNQEENKPSDISDVTLISAQPLRTFYEARYATGKPVSAELWTLPGEASKHLLYNKHLRGEEGKRAFQESIIAVSKRLNQIVTSSSVNKDEKEIIEFQLLVLMDESLISGIQEGLEDGLELTDAVTSTFDIFIDRLKNNPHEYMRARILDFMDLKKRILSIVKNGVDFQEDFSEAKDKIVLCRTLFPSDLLQLHNAGIKGVVVRECTPTSHTQILLESLDIPSLTGVKNVPMHRLDQKAALLDPLEKNLQIMPMDFQVENALKNYEESRKSVIKDIIELKDGAKCYVTASINEPEYESVKAKDAGADGVGLFRTEMNFLSYGALPHEEELVKSYRAIIKNFANEPITFRLLDIGSDKVSSIIELIEEEENPCMGNRSMRLLLKEQALFKLQLRAILKSIYKHPDCTIIFPLISSLDEWYKIDAIIKKTIDELKGEKVHIPNFKKGIMVEVPSLVTRFEDYVDIFDQFNIGTNDLTQYTLAADRNNDMVRDYYKPWHPSMISMFEKLIKLSDQHNKKLILCGQLASDLRCLPLMVGLGLRQFSVSFSKISTLKRAISELNLEDAQDKAKQAIASKSINAIEKLIFS